MTRTRDQRHGELAARVSGLSHDNALSRLTSRSIRLDWPPRLEELWCGRALVRTTANIIVRFCPKLRLAPRTTFAQEIEAILVAIDRDVEPFERSGMGAIQVHLGGGQAQADITGSSEGWLAYVSGRGEELPELLESANVLGAHACASFVASETFKHALSLREQYQWHAPKTVYSMYEYGAPTLRGPEMGSVNFGPAALLAGVGAVGQACVDVLVSGRATGELLVVDRGLVDDETNLNRSVLAVENDLQATTPKVSLALRRAEGSNLRILPLHNQLVEVIQAIEHGKIPWPSIIASALDNGDARRDLQGLWPDFLFEGATGDTMAQIFRHAFSEGLSCLRCLHQPRAATQNYEDVMSSLTRISAADITMALKDPTIKLTKEMVGDAPEELREIARKHQGGDVCGYLGDVEHYFGIKTKEPILLSVSFTSYLAGTFLAAELSKQCSDLHTLLTSRYQIDPIVNLLPEKPFAQNKDPQCYCVEHAETVTEFRSRMKKMGAAQR